MTNQFRGPYWIDSKDSEYRFPDVELALREPDGLLAVGGNLSPQRLIQAYRLGIFPWYSDGQPILWWSPDPRAVLFPEHLKISKSLRKTLTKSSYQITLDTAFDAVLEQCGKPREKAQGTWITVEIAAAYQRLHEMGIAHSVEYWQDKTLLGGLYGVAIGRVFFGESMFSLARDASKIALVYLTKQLQAWNFPLVDCQIYSEHLGTLGATTLPRNKFTGFLARYCELPVSGQTLAPTGKWCFDAGLPEQIRAGGDID